MNIDIDELSNNGSFCIAPWIHSIIDSDGTVSPCCLTSGNGHQYGSLHEKSLKQIWNSDQIKKMRLDMLNGTKRPECSECYIHEDIGKLSYREELNTEFSNHFDFVGETKEDGTFDRFNLTYWDFRLSNVCNFKCRSCGERNSTTWAKEILKEDPNKNIPVLLSVDENPSLWEEIEELYPIVEKIYFAGGEPLIMESHYKILDKLIEYERFDVRLIYSTNFSTLTYGDKNILDYWEKFPNVRVNVSIDGFEDRGELMRKGFNWNNFINNVKQFHERFVNQSHEFNFYIICTLQLLNAFHVTDLHKKLYEEGVIKDLDNFTLNFLFIPKYLSINCLPNEVKKQLLEKIKSHIVDYLKPRGANISEFVSYAKFLTTESKISELKTFVKEIERIDKIRNENTRKVFPEFEESIWNKYMT
jgi:radical SAM protein with 4Fe4S-binding SPASM domain